MNCIIERKTRKGNDRMPVDTLNKELVKHKIIKQFREKNSRLSGLMDHYAMSKGHSKRVLNCSEFDMEVLVERIGDTNQFQISFSESNNRAHKVLPSTIDLSENDSLTQTEHVMEMMDLMNNKIRFSFHKVVLYQENYQFFMDDRGLINNAWIEFDLTTGKFNNNKFLNTSDFTSYCGGFGSSKMHYHKVSPTEEQIKAILQSHWFSHLIPNARTKIQEKLVVAKFDIDKWFVHSFIEVLNIHGQSFMKGPVDRYY